MHFIGYCIMYTVYCVCVIVGIGTAITCKGIV